MGCEYSSCHVCWHTRWLDAWFYRLGRGYDYDANSYIGLWPHTISRDDTNWRNDSHKQPPINHREGTYFLFNLETEIVIKLIAVIIIGSAILQLSGWRYRGSRGILPASLAGVSCGVINGFSGLGGAPLVLYVLSGPESPDRQRATIIIAVALISFFVFIAVNVGGGMTTESYYTGFAIAIPQLIAAWIGANLFKLLPGIVFQRVSLVMLIFLGLLVLLF